MMERMLRTILTLMLALCLTLPLAALADKEDAAEMAAYWHLVGDAAKDDPLTRAMNGEYDLLSPAEKAAELAGLKAVTADELLAFAARNKLPVSMARHAWYAALADCLDAEITLNGANETERTLAVFLAMPENFRDKEANAQRRSIRKGMTEADIKAIAAETDLPAGFLCWLVLDDEWHEEDWDDGDDWLEGRRGWDIPGWADASDLREKYGKDAVVTDDDVERILYKNGYRFD